MSEHSAENDALGLRGNRKGGQIEPLRSVSAPLPEQSAEIDAPPVRVCCGQRHYGVTCPDGKVMCCVCFERFNEADLMVEDGTTYNVCKGCAPSVIPPGQGNADE